MDQNPNLPITDWTLIREIITSDPEAARASLSLLVEQYWYPLYVFFRAQQNRSHHDAEDLTQAFLAKLQSDPGILAKATPEKGRLRSYLLACAKNFALNDWSHQTAAKRDVRRTIAWDGMEAEERYALEPIDGFDAVSLFDRRWALNVLGAAVNIARAKWGDRSPSFEALRPHLRLDADPTSVTMKDLAERHGITVPAASMQLSRLRALWRDAVLQVIARTLDHPTDEEVRAELNELLRSL
jgi:DNA-directed RNA polymerase specialized sigma24 family protein